MPESADPHAFVEKTNRAANKAARLLQIEALLLAHPDGLTISEIARRLQVNRSTVWHYFNGGDLPAYVYPEEDGRLKIDREDLLVNVRLDLHEALAVHLAVRLLATRMDKRNAHAASAIRKIGYAIEKLAPPISQAMKQSADITDAPDQWSDETYIHTLEVLTRGWAAGRKVRLWHYSERTESVKEYVFCPFFIEPYAVGQTTHVIGCWEERNELRTFKIERIQRAELLAEEYTIPADFNADAVLADAWGIWFNDREPVEVRLRFHPKVAPRVKESRWHRSQQTEELPDGWLLWTARVSEPQEMLPWIRGWGANVEVLGPDAMRQAMVEEAERLAGLYRNRTGEELA